MILSGRSNIRAYDSGKGFGRQYSESNPYRHKGNGVFDRKYDRKSDKKNFVNHRPTHAISLFPSHYSRPSGNRCSGARFSLPYQVQCHGHKLAAGEYKLLVKTVGEDKMVTLQREGSDVVLHSRPVPPTSVSDHGPSAMMLRHGPGPGTHTIEGVYIENLKLVLFLDETGHANPIDKVFASVKRIPIT
jgi:hypothetical protein